ncbi:MAG TPA: hypothetical protein VMV10_31530 [Pirellulales bacterium]|nr:hypothetical protein [Pirellulales bacterium]
MNRAAGAKLASSAAAAAYSDSAKLSGGEAALAFDEFSVYDPFKLLLTASLRLLAGVLLKHSAAGCSVVTVQGNV